MKKFISIALAILMLLSAFPAMGVSAADRGNLYEESFLNWSQNNYDGEALEGGYSYNELYYHQNSGGETDWALVEAEYYSVFVPAVVVTMEIGNREIVSGCPHVPFEFGYGVYDVSEDIFVCLSLLADNSEKYAGLTDALAQLNIGQAIGSRETTYANTTEPEKPTEAATSPEEPSTEPEEPVIPTGSTEEPYYIVSPDGNLYEESFLSWSQKNYDEEALENGYSYDELYYHKNDAGETDWALVYANYNVGVWGVIVTMEIGNRRIISASPFCPFEFGYGVYDVMKDDFVCLSKLADNPEKYDGLMEALAQLNIGEVIENEPTETAKPQPSTEETTELATASEPPVTQPQTETATQPVSEPATDPKGRNVYEENFLNWSRNNYDEEALENGYSYDELYYHKNAEGETDWALVKARYNCPALTVVVTMEIGNREIVSGCPYTPFEYEYAVYDTAEDEFICLSKLADNPEKYAGLMEALAQLNIGTVIENPRPSEQQLTYPTEPVTDTPTEPTTEPVTEPATEPVTEPASGIMEEMPQPVATTPQAKISARRVSLRAGKTNTLRIKDGTVKSWKSSNKKVASVSKRGKVTALKKGTATITAILTNGQKLTVRITVTTNPKLNATKKGLKKGNAFKLKITGKAGKATFKSNNKRVAAVNSKGKIIAKKKGKATIAVTTNGMKLKCKITVK